MRKRKSFNKMMSVEDKNNQITLELLKTWEEIRDAMKCYNCGEAFDDNLNKAIIIKCNHTIC